MAVPVENATKFEAAVAEWQECWEQHVNETLDAVNVYNKFHALLAVTTRMRVSALHQIERHEHELSDNCHVYPELMSTTNAFDIPLAVSVKFEFDTIFPGDMVRATSETPSIASVVYVQRQQPSKPIETTDVHREIMKTVDFGHFQQELTRVVVECRAGFVLSANYQPLSDGSRLLDCFLIVIAVLADLQEIRPYYIDLSGEYVAKCIELDAVSHGRPRGEVPLLDAVPVGIRSMAPHAIHMCVGSGYISMLPEWLGEFKTLKVLLLVGSSRERYYLPWQVTNSSNTALRTLPVSLWRLHGLVELGLAFFMGVTTLPDSMAGMTSLCKLTLRNMFSQNSHSIPRSIQTLPALHTLHISEIDALEMQTFVDSPQPFMEPFVHLQHFRISKCE
jgi:hypothetical protein